MNDITSVTEIILTLFVWEEPYASVFWMNFSSGIFQSWTAHVKSTGQNMMFRYF